MFWGSTTGNQEEAAKFLNDYMVSEGFQVDSYDIKSTDPSKMLEYSQLIIGCPTWNVGELQEDLSLIHISEPTRQEAISYAVFCLITCGAPPKHSYLLHKFPLSNYNILQKYYAA